MAHLTPLRSHPVRPGPHHRDVPLEDILPVVLKARPQAISLEGANPRHEHEWAVFE